MPLSLTDFHTLCELASATSGHAHGPKWYDTVDRLIAGDLLAEDVVRVFQTSTQAEREAAEDFAWGNDRVRGEPYISTGGRVARLHERLAHDKGAPLPNQDA